MINQIVQINGKDYSTNKLGNFLIGLNGYRVGLSLEEIKNYGWVVETRKALKQGEGITKKITLSNGKSIELDLGGQYDINGNIDFNIRTLYPNIIKGN